MSAEPGVSMMLAYKTLDGGRSAFTGMRWPLPDSSGRGAWVDASPGPLALCRNGVHACTARQLPPWLGSELWLVELEGEVVDGGAALLAARARLVERVEDWNTQTQARFAEDCAIRADHAADGRPELMPVADAVHRCAAAGLAPSAGYWAAVVAGQRAAGARSGERYEQAFAAERAEQAAWLTAALNLI